MQRTVIAAALVLLAACEPVPEQPVKVRALVLSGNGSYVTQEVTLTTITDIIRMEGSVAKLIGGARIVLDPNDPELQGAQTETAFAEALIKASGRPVTANWIQKDGVLWPADFHTWNLATTYYNLEKAQEYFNVVGNIQRADFGEPVPVYYFADFVLADVGSDPIKDNALFFAPTQSFMVVPFDTLQKAPLSINAGVMAHEYSHFVFNKKVYGGRRLPDPIVLWGNSSVSPGANLIKSLDEGLADYHGFGATCATLTGCDSRFLRTSFDDKVAGDRDLNKAGRCMTPLLEQQLTQTSLAAFSGQGKEYEVGSILATALYFAGQAADNRPEQHKTLQRAIISAYTDESTNIGLKQLITASLNDQTNFSLKNVATVLVNHVTDPELKRALCNQLIDRFRIPAAELVGSYCPATSQGGTVTCQ